MEKANTKMFRWNLSALSAFCNGFLSSASNTENKSVEGQTLFHFPIYVLSENGEIL